MKHKLIIEWQDYGTGQQDITIWKKDNSDTKEVINVLEFVKEQLKSELSPLCNL